MVYRTAEYWLLRCSKDLESINCIMAFKLGNSLQLHSQPVIHLSMVFSRQNNRQFLFLRFFLEIGITFFLLVELTKAAARGRPRHGWCIRQDLLKVLLNHQVVHLKREN